jgi:hypothetical protein
MQVYENVLNSRVKLFETDAAKNFQISWSQLDELESVITGQDAKSLPPSLLKMLANLNCPAGMWPVLASPALRKSITERRMRFAHGLSSHSGYLSIWHKIRTFLDSLQNFDLNVRKIASESVNIDALLKHLNNQINGMARIEYSTSGTTTGRLIVTNGPNFLTLPREARSCIQSSRKDARIYSIDFTSLEPRVALWEGSDDLGFEDVYASVMQMCEVSNRDDAKLATLSALYGAGVRRLSAQLGNLRAAKQLMERVKDYFGIAQLQQKLDGQANQGIIKNRFGRPLHEAVKQPRLRVNHYVQSTAAELALLLFADLCEPNPEVRPLVVIHDALIVEVPDASKDKFFSDASNLHFEGTWFPTKVEEPKN